MPVKMKKMINISKAELNRLQNDNSICLLDKRMAAMVAA